MKDFIVVDNFIEQSECDEIIAIYDKRRDYSFRAKQGNTYPIHINRIPEQIELLFYPYSVQAKFAQYFKNSRLDTYVIVRWPEGGHMTPHIDTGDHYSFIIYLNENFDGGETVIRVRDKHVIKPATGRLLLFNNGELSHCVMPVANGERYTLAGWYLKE